MKYAEKLFLISLFFIVLTLASPSSIASANKPIADFSANVTGGTVPLIVKFTDESAGGSPVSWHWDFGDGIYSKHTANATHTFVKPGLYNITLTVTNADGSSCITKPKYINVENVTDASGKNFDPSGTRWSVAGFETGYVREYHSVPWEFHSNYYMNAGDIWTGNWSFIPDYPDRIHTYIMHRDGSTDECDVIFVSPNWFVAVKDDELYRLGKRI